MTVFSCPIRGKRVNLHNHHDIDELYDLQNESRQTKKPLYMSNQFIHAYTSYVLRDATRNWSDVYIVSDFDRNDCLWRVPVGEVHRLFSTAAEDYPHSFEMIYSKEKEDFEVTTN